MRRLAPQVGHAFRRDDAPDHQSYFPTSASSGQEAEPTKADYPAANPRRAAWTSARRLAAASCASEGVILAQPCEGDLLAQGWAIFRLPTLAGVRGHHCVGLQRRRAPLRSSSWRSPARGISLRKAGSPGRSRLRRDDAPDHQSSFPTSASSGQEAEPTNADYPAASPGRGAWTSAHWLAAALCASEAVILAQPCEGDALAQGWAIFRLPALAGVRGHQRIGLWRRCAPLRLSSWRSPARGIPLRRLAAPRGAGQDEDLPILW